MTDVLNSMLQSLGTPGMSVLGIGSARMEFLGAAWAMVLVLCTIRVNQVVWPLAIAGHLLQAVVFWQYGLNGETFVQMLFVAMAVWAWLQWLGNRQRVGEPMNIGALSNRQRIDIAMVWLLLWPVLTFALGQLTDADRPGWDAFVTAGQVLAVWLLGRKLIEYWPVFIIVSTATMVLLVCGRSWLVLPLYGLLVAIALWGWRRWLHSLRPT